METVRDENRVDAKIAALNTDGDTPIRVKVNPANHAIMANMGVSGTDYGSSVASRDQNRRPVMMGVSSVDGVTPVEVYADANGNLLVQGI